MNGIRRQAALTTLAAAVVGATLAAPAVSSAWGAAGAQGVHEATGTQAATGTQPATVSQTLTPDPATTSQTVTDAITVSPAPTTAGDTVQVSVDGKPVGSPVPVSTSDGTASKILGTLPASDAGHTVVATFSGDSTYASSSSSPSSLVVSQSAVTNPTIRTTLSSRYPKTSYGWYRAPVTVRFSCTRGSADLTAGCPAAVKVAAEGRNQSVTRTVQATDGGTATVTVNHIDVDRSKPRVQIRGVVNGHTYPHGAHLHSRATDAVSGVAASWISFHRHGMTVHYVLTAVDRAGNVNEAKGHFRF